MSTVPGQAGISPDELCLLEIQRLSKAPDIGCGQEHIAGPPAAIAAMRTGKVVFHPARIMACQGIEVSGFDTQGPDLHYPFGFKNLQGFL